MINGAHIIIYSKDADADRAFFKDVLGFHHVDAGHGWLPRRWRIHAWKSCRIGFSSPAWRARWRKPSKSAGITMGNERLVAASVY